MKRESLEVVQRLPFPSSSLPSTSSPPPSPPLLLLLLFFLPRPPLFFGHQTGISVVAKMISRYFKRKLSKLVSYLSFLSTLEILYKRQDILTICGNFQPCPPPPLPPPSLYPSASFLFFSPASLCPFPCCRDFRFDFPDTLNVMLSRAA